MQKNNFLLFFGLLLSSLLFIQPAYAKEIVEPDRQSGTQLGKTDFDRMARATGGERGDSQRRDM